MIYLWLSNRLKNPNISIRIKNNKGKEIIRFENADDSKNKLKLIPGLNKFIWNLCEQGPIEQDKSLIKRKYEPFSKSSKLAGGSGVKVMPGTYQIELKVNDSSKAISFEVVKDPRVMASKNDLEEQYNLAVDITNKLSELHIALNRIRLMNSQLEHMLRVTPDKKTTIESLILDLKNIEGSLVSINKETPSDVLRHPAGLDDTLKDLLSLIIIADAKPPQQSEEVSRGVFVKVDKILDDLDKLVETKVKKFNSDIGKLKPPVITAQSISAPKTGW